MYYMPFSRRSSGGDNSSMVYLLLFCCCCTIMIGLGVGGYFYFSDGTKCDEITDKTDCSDNENCKWDSSDSVCVKKCNSIDNSSDCNDNYHCNWNSSDSVCEIYTPPTDNTPTDNTSTDNTSTDNTPTDDNSNSDPSGENLPNTSTVSCGEGLEIDPSNPGSCRVISSTDGTSGTNTPPAPAPAPAQDPAPAPSQDASSGTDSKTCIRNMGAPEWLESGSCKNRDIPGETTYLSWCDPFKTQDECENGTIDLYGSEWDSELSCFWDPTVITVNDYCTEKVKDVQGSKKEVCQTPTLTHNGENVCRYA